MAAPYRVTRRIEIDAGHRIMTHGSKCRHLHGHRYAVEAVCEAAELHHDGEQTDMVVDFGFLKEEMLTAIDAPCDHGFIAAIADTELLTLFAPAGADARDWMAALAARVAAEGEATTTDTRLGTRLTVVGFQPTAECLARHWFTKLAGPVRQRSGGTARLVLVRVFETPNCAAEYGE
ncbi:6-carboxytetrahydropterin synthase [Magnetospirillum sp. UT-4]|uniref:6-carboxytetrahydropterin synthase n=1 Tax=Magnetospirillum sp. UT-4 TaxID=2681467 RepID=UPI0013860D11|nr:6-carboxytetrahydropterin synthase [Magnetospirillum sp. UT-4]CAA7624546.1 putative 6-carboxy-5,6,7,8-tetrahydropterin synthase [Magnetospirillum sp. UT-4]